MTDRVRSASPFEAEYGFCRARRVDRTIYVAGTAPIPQDGTLPPESAHDQMLLAGNIALDAVLSLGGKVADVVRTRMFITDATFADDVGRAHAALFGSGEPVATMVVVAGLLDPSWKVELEIEAQLR